VKKLLVLLLLLGIVAAIVRAMTVETSATEAA
jgi:hypothetical protein